MVFDLTKTFPSSYEIRVAGRIAAERADWFSGLDLETQATPEGATITVLSGTLADQAALFGVTGLTEGGTSGRRLLGRLFL